MDSYQNVEREKKAVFPPHGEREKAQPHPIDWNRFFSSIKLKVKCLKPPVEVSIPFCCVNEVIVDAGTQLPHTSPRVFLHGTWGEVRGRGRENAVCSSHHSIHC